MIPIKLQLKNFLSYGPQLQTINFGNYPLICLSGKNGHGKSALLDAMTWAIWGHARKTSNTSKADQGLLRLGQTNMTVIFEFEYNAHHYQIRREFSFSYGKPHTALDFGVFDTTKQAYVPLTDKTIRKTQETIENTIRLDFESFINSAFLRQGHANEFSQKSPKERKEILATILGLNRYEEVRKRASEKVRTHSAQIIALQALQEKRKQELEQKEPVVQSLSAVTEQLSKVMDQEQSCYKAEQIVQQKREQLIADKKKYELLQVQREQLSQKELQHLQALTTYRTQWRSAHITLLQHKQDPDIEKKKEQAVYEIKQHQQILKKNLLLKEQLLQAKEQLQHISHQLLSNHTQHLQQQQLALERLVLEKNNYIQQNLQLKTQQMVLEQEKNNSCNTLELLRKQQVTQETDSKIFEKELVQFEKRKEYYQRFIAQGNWVKKELDGLQQRTTLVHDDQDSSSCPLCEQNLSASRRRFLKQKCIKTEQFLMHRLSRLTELITSLKQVLIEQHTLLQHKKTMNERYSIGMVQLEQKQKEYETTILALQKIDNEQHSLLEKIATLEKTIAAEQELIEHAKKEFTSYCSQDQSYLHYLDQMTKIEKELQSTSYNQTVHEQAEQTLVKLEQQESLQRELAQEHMRQQERAIIIQQHCVLLKQMKQEKRMLDEALTQYLQLLVYESELGQETQKLAQQRSALSTVKTQVLQEKGRLEQQQEQLNKLELDYKQQESLIKTIEQTIDDFQAIAAATGKDGIQALLIEDTLPEIEHEANKLLAKLTDNQAHIIIESLRDLKKGGTRETLDIKVSDTMGIRPYELFSGGEAFRIDFALRIAISKLLARRAGASLQTLIIDEGFGSQDEDGLSKMMDAIYKIQDDFAKVIIVSHLPTMKDQFPIHLVINKGPNGSIVNMIEQG